MEKSLDQKKFLGAVLVDLSKAFDSIPHDLLIAKMHAYSFSKNSLVFFNSYLKRSKQNIRINNNQYFSNLIFNDLLLWISNSELLTFAENNTISATEDSIEKLISTFEKKVKQPMTGSYQTK